MARPLKDVDENLVEGLAAIGCTDREIAVLSGVSIQTLDRRFGEILDKGRQTLKMKLRRWQLQAAERGSTAMLIFLGKNLLGQRDAVQLDVNQLDSEIERQLAGMASRSEGEATRETEGERIM